MKLNWTDGLTTTTVLQSVCQLNSLYDTQGARVGKQKRGAKWNKNKVSSSEVLIRSSLRRSTYLYSIRSQENGQRVKELWKKKSTLIPIYYNANDENNVNDDDVDDYDWVMECMCVAVKYNRRKKNK